MLNGLLLVLYPAARSAAIKLAFLSATVRAFCVLSALSLGVLNSAFLQQ